MKAGVTRRPVTDLEAENSQLKRALAEMKMERDLLKESDGVLSKGIAVRYALMHTLQQHFPVVLMGRVFEVSKSGYSAWLKRSPSKRAQDNVRLEVAIKAAHVRTRESYGPERLQQELSAGGFHAGVGRIKRMRKSLGIRCKHLNREVLMSRRLGRAESDEAQVQSDHAFQSWVAGGGEPAEAGV